MWECYREVCYRWWIVSVKECLVSHFLLEMASCARCTEVRENGKVYCKVLEIGCVYLTVKQKSSFLCSWSIE